jgi:ATP-binding cassette subfamily C protein LapB
MLNSLEAPNWADNVQWLARRLSMLDGRLQSLTPAETLLMSQDLAAAAESTESTKAILSRVALFMSHIGISVQRWMKVPREHMLPLLGVGATTGVCLVHGRAAESRLWMVETPKGRMEMPHLPTDMRFNTVTIGWREKLASGAAGVFSHVLMKHKKPLVYFALASFTVNLLALFTSLYSMQVYDRVIPSRGTDTLGVLTIGVAVAIVFELVLKFMRSHMMDQVVRKADMEISHLIFERLMRVRMDQFPASVGTLASQLRSYELIRAFAYSATTYLVVDTPFALIFLALIFMIGGPVVAAIPLAFLLVSMVLGLSFKARTERHTRQSQASSNRKLGLLVEAVDGAETIKLQGLRWHFLNRWNALTRQHVTEDSTIRQINEASSYYAASLQQLSYVLLVAAGAYVASTSNDLTSGGLIACSILSGRVLQPVTMLPGLLSQWASSKAALAGIDAIFKLRLDHHDLPSPISLDVAQGAYELDKVVFGYPGQNQKLEVPQLTIKPGEKIGIIGGIGSGKSTLLKLLSGLYKPVEGQVLIDRLDIQHVSRAHLSQHIGVISQNVQLFAGTLKDNLTSGLMGVSEESLRTACQATGLAAFIGTHPQGLAMPIAEGGGGVSGGQRQLIGLTRLLLTFPTVWLLDEPSSSMDDESERRALNVLGQAIAPNQTMVLVTHKASALSLVSRLIVMSAGKVVLDGPRDAILAQLRSAHANAAAAAASADTGRPAFEASAAANISTVA